MSIDPRHHYQPSWRKPVGMLGIMALIVVWAVLVASLSPLIGQMWMVAQVVIYVVLGIAWIWILPLRQLLQWMETGTWRPPVDR
jgi:predicted tellurium resistance membrane protein TerC